MFLLFYLNHTHLAKKITIPQLKLHLDRWMDIFATKIDFFFVLFEAKKEKTLNSNSNICSSTKKRIDIE
jgi:hypothetical protein